MKEYVGPIQGIVVGVLLIVFRDKVAIFLRKSVERFPKYKDGEKTFNLKYSIRPIFIIILGVLFILISCYGLFTISNLE
jgi:hypothetical protein